MFSRITHGDLLISLGVHFFGWLTAALHAGFSTLLHALATIPLAVALILIVLSFILFFSATFLSVVIAGPYTFFVRTLRVLGVVHDRRTWGVVYDSVTKEPIDPAYVTVRNRLGVVAATAITDLDGRFGIILPQGTYTLLAEKTHYAFPSKRLTGKATDGYYSGLYFGDWFDVTTSERSVAFAVPMDPLGDDWNQQEKKRRRIKTADRKNFRQAATLYFLIAMVLIAARYLTSGERIALQLLGTGGLVLLFGFLYDFFKPSSYYHSVIIDAATHQPLGFARIKVFNATTKIQVSTKTSSFNGQFVCLVPNGTYYLTIERRTENGTYAPAYTSAPFRVVDRSINREFIV